MGGGGLNSKNKVQLVSHGNPMLKGAGSKQLAKRVGGVPYRSVQGRMPTTVLDLFPKVKNDTNLKAKRIAEKLDNKLNSTKPASLSNVIRDSAGGIRQILSPNSPIRIDETIKRKIKLKANYTLDDIADELHKFVVYVYDHSSLYAKVGRELTIGSRYAGEVSHFAGFDVNLMSVRLLKAEFVADSRKGFQESNASWLNNRDKKGNIQNTFSHGLELAAIYGVSAKHEYQMTRGQKTSQTSELQGARQLPIPIIPIPLSLIIKIEYDHITGNKILRLAVNSSLKQGTMFVGDVGGEAGIAISIPNNE